MSTNNERAGTPRKSLLFAAAVPVILVNGVAFAGQLAFLRAHLPWPLEGQLMMAAALESIAIYLAFHAHVAALANDSALRLRLASYGFAVVIATMNYSHYAAHNWRPTFPAVAVGLMSASSPWLWGVHSRRASRDQMIAAGLIEGHALRLGSTRWLWHPLRSARVMYHATWAGVTDPRQALARWGTRPGDAPAAAPRTATVTRHRKPSKSRQARVSDADMEARALAEMSRQPAISGADLGRAIGASPRTGQRLLSRLSGRATEGVSTTP